MIAAGQLSSSEPNKHHSLASKSLISDQGLTRAGRSEVPRWGEADRADLGGHGWIDCLLLVVLCRVSCSDLPTGKPGL
jgi:hypothetical protein